MLSALGALHATALSSLFIPSPSHGVWEIGPFPLRGYAVCIIAGVIAAVWMGEKRWMARGGQYGDVQDIAIWAVPFGLVGARLYHVATDWELYFGDGKNPVEALYLWNGGLGIWGGIAFGALGAWIGARRRRIRFLPLADALAPGLLVAQAIGRWGNWFNQELFGKPTERPWGLEIDPIYRPDGYEQFATFHPTFLYECLWNLAAAALIIWLDRRYRLGHGRVLALYVLAYTAGRGWNEMLRIDEVQLNNVLGLRWNVWMSLLLFVAAVVYLVLTRHDGREESVYDPGREPVADESSDTPASTSTSTTTANGKSSRAKGDAPKDSSKKADPAED